MHIILNVESLIKPSGGIGRYTKNLLEGLIKHPDIKKVSCFSGKQWLDAQEFANQLDAREDQKPLTEALPSIHVIKISTKTRIRHFLRSLPLVYKAYAFYRAWVFSRQSQKYHDAIYHEPNFILKPFSGVSIPTIHDLSHQHFPQYHPAERVAYMKKHFHETLTNAAHIITDAEYIKQELIDKENISAGKITAIPLGVEDSYKPRQADDIQSVLNKYNLQYAQFLLTVSTIEPRKNIEQLLDAYSQVDKAVKKLYPLTLIGNDGWNNQLIKNKIKQLEKKGEVKYLGFVSEEDLPIIMSAARGFVFVPYYEGFGLPPLEAMASGVPVLTSNVSSLPEVVADVGLMVEPNDQDAITLSIQKLLTDEDWRKTAIKQGLERASQFSWEKCINKTIEIYRRYGEA